MFVSGKLTKPTIHRESDSSRYLQKEEYAFEDDKHFHFQLSTL